MQTSKTFFRIVTLTLAVTLITACSKEAKKTRFLAEADNYFKAGDYDKAKVNYLNVVRLDPQNALAFERIGNRGMTTPPPRALLHFWQRRANWTRRTPKIEYGSPCYLAMGQFAKAKKKHLRSLSKFRTVAMPLSR